MIPIGPILVAAAMASRAGNGGGGGPREPARWAVLVWTFFGVPFAIFAILVVAGEVRSWEPFAVMLPMLLFLFPWPIARGLLVPLGLARTAYCVTVLSDHLWRIDHRGGGAVAGAWALLRQRGLDRAAADWIERRLAAGKQLRGGGVVAVGLLAIARGDLDGARAVLASVDSLDVRACPPLARKLAAEWLCADAMARGDWTLAASLGTDLGPRTRATRFLGLAATRILGRPVGRFALVWRWLLSSERLELWPLLRRAQSTTPVVSPEGRPEVTPPADRVEHAMSLHASVLSRPPAEVTADDLASLGRAWDAALGDGGLQRHAMERALSLGLASSSAGDQAVAHLGRTVVDDLARLAKDAQLPIGELVAGDVIARAARLLRNELLGEIETFAERIAARAVEQRELPATDEWREWTAMRILYERAARLGGLELRRLAFPKVHTDVCKLAVWLWNVRKQRTMANAIFRWLHDEAIVVGDARAIELEAKNLRCGV